VLSLPTGRTPCAVYFEIRRIKRLAQGVSTKAKSARGEGSPSPQDPAPTTPVELQVKTRPVRKTRPSEKKRQYDEHGDSGFGDDSGSDGHFVRRAKRVKVGTTADESFRGSDEETDVGEKGGKMEEFESSGET